MRPPGARPDTESIMPKFAWYPARRLNRIAGPLVAAGLVIAVCAGASNAARAQDLRIYTRLYETRRPAEISADSAPPAKPAMIGHSLSLFHAGKVYDYIDNVGEVTIFEPAQRRFAILNAARMMGALVAFDALEVELYGLEKRSEARLQMAVSQGDVTAAKIAAARFQLHPSFSEQVDARQKRIHLASQHLTYDVQYATDQSAEIIEAYVRYANWTARLNSLLTPPLKPPAPRLALNAIFQKHHALPLTVELQTAGGETVLRAEHQYTWKLEPGDRRMISEWEDLRSNRKIQWVSFHDFRRVQVATQTRK